MITPSDSVKVIKGIGDKKARLLENMNITTIEDFLFFFPREYQDRGQIQKISKVYTGDAAFIRAKILAVNKTYARFKKRQIIKILVSDGSDTLEAVFFNGGFLINFFKEGSDYDFYGKITESNGKKQMIHPEYAKASQVQETGILPVYPLTAGISQAEMRKWQREAVRAVDLLLDPLPPEIVSRNRLCSLSYAISNVHFPQDRQKCKEARYRLVFDELFFLQTGLFAIKNNHSIGREGICFSKKAKVSDFTGKLPYALTGAQSRVIGEIMTDMESSTLMNRLVQGDVGSGKTVIAQTALFKAYQCGYQGVLMAPTEILANQHYRALKGDFEPFGITVGLLTGSMGSKARREILEKLENGEIHVLIGTHAVLQPDVQFKKLGIVVTDEQHRFGVSQRMLLAQKGENPDVLVMSATPIPRTLAMILYGDLDISIIDELPPGRKKILTKAFDANQRDVAYVLLKEELQKGRQAYVIAPLIDDSDVIDAKSAESLFEELRVQFDDWHVALIHGGMKQKEKDATMHAFRQGEIQLLVCTVVIEVGIDVPNASVMVIENAERFGLAQLHQLRGRVGRGGEQSYCFLINESDSPVAEKRASLMEQTADGFLIAEKDLELRGPGEFFGTRQHGIPELKIADLIKHVKVLSAVKEEAKKLLEADGKLEQPEHKAIKEKLQRQFDWTL